MLKFTCSRSKGEKRACEGAGEAKHLYYAHLRRGDESEVRRKN